MRLSDYPLAVQTHPWKYVTAELRKPGKSVLRYDTFLDGVVCGFINFEHDPSDVFRREALYPLFHFDPPPKQNGIGSMALYQALVDLNSMKGGPFTLSPGDVDIYEAQHVYRAVELDPYKNHPLDAAIDAFENYLRKKGRLQL